MWTEQTVETLKKFALEGRSAAWIATALGAPSRSAVIGKANRIGIKLAGAPRPQADPRPASRAGDGRAARGSTLAGPGGRAPVPAEVGAMRRIGLVDLGEDECRWPLGDPEQDDFAYCGLGVARGRAYCAGHCRLIYRR